jgi:2-oxoglutarate ferredoxin oxidoreductase subunit alpha
VLPKVVTIKIAGPAGAGIKSSGLLLSRILLDHGANIRDYSEYPSLVRGGHNTYQVSFSGDEIFAPHFAVDLFFSLTPGHWQQHTKEFTKTSLVFAEDAKTILPLSDLSAEIGGPIYKNTICLGVVAFILNLDKKICQKNISLQFKGDEKNLSAFNLGFDYASEKFKKLKIFRNWKLGIRNLSIYDGNEAFGWGFLKGGGNFYTAYPMTPASGALHFLAQKQVEYNIQVLHPEDEIAAASLCAGAAFAGARTATGTSGGGFALMTETISFCGVANLGVVFYLVSRPGPATGLPTWTAQGDLLFAVHSGHGEFGKIVLAPGDQYESFEMSHQALNLAAKFNIPVIVISDKFIAESSASTPSLSLEKVKIVTSKKPIPGTESGEYMANSYEHDEAGFSIEDSVTVNKMVTRRLAQTKKILPFLPKPTFYFGSKSSTTLIVTWGSTKSTVWEALKILKNPNIAHLHFSTLWPIDPNVKLLFKPFKKIIVIENNATSQLTTLLKSQFDFNPTKTILKFDGRPFFPEELIKSLTNDDL